MNRLLSKNKTKLLLTCLAGAALGSFLAGFSVCCPGAYGWQCGSVKTR